MNERLISTGEAARRLGVDRGSVLWWCADGHVPGAVQVGPYRRWRLPAAWVDAMVETVTVNHVAHVLGVNERTVRSWCESRLIHGAVRVGRLGRWRIPRAWIVGNSGKVGKGGNDPMAGVVGRR